MAYDFGSIEASVNLVAPTIVIFGEEKIGKTTFGSQAPNPICMNLENGSNYVKMARAFDGKGTPPRPRPHEATYYDCIELINYLRSAQHNYQTLVVDSIDWLEARMEIYVAGLHGATSIHDANNQALSYGRAANLMREEMERFTQHLECLREERDMVIIVIAHAERKEVTDDPMDDNHQKSTIKLSKKNEAWIKEWADCILYARQKVYVTKKDGGFNKKVGKATTEAGEDNRILLTGKSPAYAGGSRINLPPELPLSWFAFDEAFRASVSNIENNL